MIGGLENGIPSVFRAALEKSHPGQEVPEAGVLWINAEFLTFHCYNDTIWWRKTVALFSIHYMSGTIQGKL